MNKPDWKRYFYSLALCVVTARWALNDRDIDGAKRSLDDAMRMIDEVDKHNELEKSQVASERSER